jgi:glycosyltransferase involved in cell wall biosynthesis
VTEAAAPRISVVIPCFNDGLLLRETLATVPERADIEVVVVDDGSTDRDTIDYLDGLDRPFLRVQRQPNAGVAEAINTGARDARGTYVFPLASDDLLCEGALDDLAAALDAASPNVVFAFGHARLFGSLDYLRKAPPWNPWLLTYANFWPATSLFRRDALLAAGGFQKRSGYDDWDLLMLLAERDQEGVLVDRIIFWYRIHGSGRIMATALGNFRAEYDNLARWHAPLFARRAELRKRYPPTRAQRIYYPLSVVAGRTLPPGLVPRLHALKVRLASRAGGRPRADVRP